MVFVPLPPELDDDDESVLEATRQLSQYVASQRRGGHAMEAPAAVDLRFLLQQRITTLAEEVMKHEVEFQDLRHRSTELPVEVQQLQEENALLARRGAQICEEQAQQAARNGALEEQQQQKMEEVQRLAAERSAVLLQVESAEGREAMARKGQESASKSLDLEQRRSQDLVRTLTSALQQRQQQTEDAERRALQAEREATGLEESCVGAPELKKAEDIAEAESLRRQQMVEQLETELEYAEVQRGEQVEERRRWQRHEHARQRAQGTQQRLVEARLEARRLEDAAQLVAKQLAESEQKAEESDQKAIAVAKELNETSKTVAMLRSELGGMVGYFKDLDAAHKEAGALQQRLVGPGRSPLEEERAMKEALRSAWEREAHERKQTDDKLHRADVFWQRLQEQLQSLTSLAHRCRRDLPGLAGSLPLPEPCVWTSGAGTAASLTALVNFFESLAQLRHGGHLATTVEGAGHRVPSLSSSPARSAPWR